MPFLGGALCGPLVRRISCCMVCLNAVSCHCLLWQEECFGDIQGLPSIIARRVFWGPARLTQVLQGSFSMFEEVLRTYKAYTGFEGFFFSF